MNELNKNSSSLMKCTFPQCSLNYGIRVNGIIVSNPGLGESDIMTSSEKGLKSIDVGG